MPLEFNQDQGNFQKTCLPDPDKIYETMCRKKKRKKKTFEYNFSWNETDKSYILWNPTDIKYSSLNMSPSQN